MRKERKVTLGGVDYPLGKFTLGQVSAISVLLKNIGTGATAAEESARRTVLYKGLQSGGYAGTFEQFEALEDVTVGELIVGVNEVGKAVGYYVDPEAAAPGEAAGAASP